MNNSWSLVSNQNQFKHFQAMCALCMQTQHKTFLYQNMLVSLYIQLCITVLNHKNFVYSSLFKKMQVKQCPKETKQSCILYLLNIYKRNPLKPPRRPSPTFLSVICLLASFLKLSNHIFYFVFPCPRKLITLLQPVNA